MRDAVRERARSYFGDLSPAHDWQHVRRVVRLAKRLADETDAAVDREALVAAAWLHDVGRQREDEGEIDDHAEWGTREARRILDGLGADDATADAVAHCIRVHRFSNDLEPESVEAELLCDADNLDALGAVGVARACCYGSELGTPMHDPDLPPEADESAAGRTQFNHLHKKLLSLHERMYTDAGRSLAAEREAFVRTFADRFEAEVRADR
jgi:uncharacterized protein